MKRILLFVTCFLLIQQIECVSPDSEARISKERKSIGLETLAELRRS